MKINKLILLAFITGALLTPSCEPDKKMLVETGDVSNISTKTAAFSGTLIDEGEGITRLFLILILTVERLIFEKEIEE